MGKQGIQTVGIAVIFAVRTAWVRKGLFGGCFGARIEMRYIYTLPLKQMTNVVCTHHCCNCSVSIVYMYGVMHTSDSLGHATECQTPGSVLPEMQSAVANVTLPFPLPS